MVSSDYEPYVSPASGKLVSGRRERIEDLKRTGCRPYDLGEKEAWLKRKGDRQAAFDKVVETVTEKAAQKMGLIRNG
jgi:hypothetical protein